MMRHFRDAEVKGLRLAMNQATQQRLMSELVPDLQTLSRRFQRAAQCFYQAAPQSESGWDSFMASDGYRALSDECRPAGADPESGPDDWEWLAEAAAALVTAIKNATLHESERLLVCEAEEEAIEWLQLMAVASDLMPQRSGDLLSICQAILSVDLPERLMTLMATFARVSPREIRSLLRHPDGGYCLRVSGRPVRYYRGADGAWEDLIAPLQPGESLRWGYVAEEWAGPLLSQLDDLLLGASGAHITWQSLRGSSAGMLGTEAPYAGALAQLLLGTERIIEWKEANEFLVRRWLDLGRPTFEAVRKGIWFTRLAPKREVRLSAVPMEVSCLGPNG